MLCWRQLDHAMHGAESSRCTIKKFAVAFFASACCCSTHTAAAGPTVSCPAAISIKNTGNVVMDIATQPGSAACNATSLAPLQSLTCSLTRSVLQSDREQGYVELEFEASGQTAGSEETPQNYSTSARLNVTQLVGMTWTVQETNPSPHASNSKSHSMHMFACLKPWNLLGLLAH